MVMTAEYHMRALSSLPDLTGNPCDRAALRLDRRSVYLLRGPSREDWEHSIPAVAALRYSITFRSLRYPAPR